eukprot:gene2724-14368_t
MPQTATQLQQARPAARRHVTHADPPPADPPAAPSVEALAQALTKALAAPAPADRGPPPAAAEDRRPWPDQPEGRVHAFSVFEQKYGDK